jgi:hypothetical protein
MYKGRIQAAVNDFIYKASGKELLDIYVREDLRHLGQPSNHHLLPDIFKPETGRLGPYSKLYFGLVEEIGRCLELSDFGHEDSYLSGQYFCRMWFDAHGKRLTRPLHTILDLFELAPPALLFFWALPRSADYAAGRYFPGQTALQGLFGGLDEKFQELLWVYQSWMFFRRGQSIPGAENLTPAEFFDHCYSTSNLFHKQHVRNLALLRPLEARLARKKAEQLPPGEEREGLLKKASRAETAAHIDEWANSPGI